MGDGAPAARGEADWEELRDHPEVGRHLEHRHEAPIPHRPLGTAPRPRFTEEQLRDAVAVSRSWAETLRRLGYRTAGGNWKTIKRYVAAWGISTAHFDPHAASAEALQRRAKRRKPIEAILVSNSSYSRSHLKRRLFEEGLKAKGCELCGQGETWRGQPMALILDHINGVPNDHRLENLRIVCPNCAATLKTHCGRKNRKPPRTCGLCGESFQARYRQQRYCSRDCGQRANRLTGERRRKAPRPPRDQLLAEVNELGYLAVGRRYGVSDNAIRKWIRQYEREQAIEEGRDPTVVEIPRRTWPNRRHTRDTPEWDETDESLAA
jgi:transposase-like protein